MTDPDDYGPERTIKNLRTAYKLGLPLDKLSVEGCLSSCGQVLHAKGSCDATGVSVSAYYSMTDLIDKKFCSECFESFTDLEGFSLSQEFGPAGPLEAFLRGLQILEGLSGLEGKTWNNFEHFHSTLNYLFFHIPSHHSPTSLLALKELTPTLVEGFMSAWSGLLSASGFDAQLRDKAVETMMPKFEGPALLKSLVREQIQASKKARKALLKDDNWGVLVTSSPEIEMLALKILYPPRVKGGVIIEVPLLMVALMPEAPSAQTGARLTPEAYDTLVSLHSLHEDRPLQELVDMTLAL